MRENKHFFALNINKMNWSVKIFYIYLNSFKKLVYVMKHHHIKCIVMCSDLNCACADSLPALTLLFGILPLDGEWKYIQTTDNNDENQPRYLFDTNICKI